MSDAGSGRSEAPDVAVRAASDCPDGVADIARRVVDADGRRWVRELLSGVFGAFPDPPATRRDALRAATAVELLVGYRRTRTPFGTSGAENASPEGEWRLLLAGDSLLALAFETVGTLSVDPPVVAECFAVMTRAAEEAARGDEFDAVVAELTTELGAVLGGARERTREESRRCGRAIGAAVASDTGVDRQNGEWRAVRRVVGSVGDADLRRELNAFVDELARRPCRKKGLNGR